MKNNIISTIITAAVIEFASGFLPLKNNSPLLKYVRYIISLVIALTVIAPVTGLFNSDNTDIFSYFNNMPKEEAQISTYPYLYITENAVLQADENGNVTSETNVFCDLYVRECALNIADKARNALTDKFALEPADITVGIALDLTDTANIDIICVRVHGAYGYLASDIRDYLASELGCVVYTE